MKAREPYVRKHVHRWKLAKKTPAVDEGWLWSGFGQSEWHESAPMKLVRECEDCPARQVADVTDESLLVPGYEAVCDFEWKEESK